MNSKTKMKYTSGKGITLIALVITIIVLLILAGVTINMVLGDDGIIAQAQGANQAQKEESVKEAVELWIANNEIANYSGEGETEPSDLISDMIEDGLITNDNVEGNTITVGSYTVDLDAVNPAAEPIVGKLTDYAKVGETVKYTGGDYEGDWLVIANAEDGVEIVSKESVRDVTISSTEGIDCVDKLWDVSAEYLNEDLATESGVFTLAQCLALNNIVIDPLDYVGFDWER